MAKDEVAMGFTDSAEVNDYPMEVENMTTPLREASQTVETEQPFKKKSRLEKDLYIKR